MKSSPKVSVIVPVYNTEPYLEQCLDSIRNQTLKDIEVICVDDSSSDGSLDILRRYEKSDHRFIVITQEKSNAGEARNRGLSIASGEYLSFLDSDDFFHPEMLEKAYHCAKNHQSDIVVFRAQRYWEINDEYTSIDWTVKRELLPPKSDFKVDEISQDVFSCILGYAWDKLFSRSFIQKIDAKFQSLPVFNDSFFTYSALLQASKISLLDEELIFQRKRAEKQSITDRRAIYFDCSYHLLHALYVLLDTKGLLKHYKRDFINYAVHLFSVDLANKQGETRKKMIHSLKENWIPEFGLYQNDRDYFYNAEEFEQFIANIFPVVNYQQIQEYYKAQQTVIPVVYATDDNYFKYVVSSIVSVVQNSFSGIFYRFIILQHKNSSNENREILEQTISSYDNCSVEFFEIGNQFENAHLCIEHITVATYYRLLLPELLPDCDKCIYLDGDTIVADDLLGLYTVPIDGYHLAGVKAYVYYETAFEHRERLKIPSNLPFEYINAGVLLMNLKQMRTDRCMEKYMSLINEKFNSQDQDILNIVSAGKIKTLPFRYNVMTKYCRWSRERLQALKIQDDVLLGRQKPIIVHYADRIKPWNTVQSMLAEYWWRTVLSIPCWNVFWEDKLELVLSALYKKEKKKNSEVIRLEKELCQLKSSRSCRIGRFITFVPRKIRGGIWCCRDHGIRYTLWRAWQKIRKAISA